MRKNAVLHALAHTEVSDDEVGGVVKQVADQETDPDCGPWAGCDAHEGDHQKTCSEHAGDCIDDCRGGADVSASVVVIFVLIPGKKVTYIAHIIVYLFDNELWDFHLKKRLRPLKISWN